MNGTSTGERALWITALAVTGVAVVGASLAMSSQAPAAPPPAAGSTTPPPGGTPLPAPQNGLTPAPTTPTTPTTQLPVVHSISVTNGSTQALTVNVIDTIDITTPAGSTSGTSEWPTPIFSKPSGPAAAQHGLVKVNGAITDSIPAGSQTLTVKWTNASGGAESAKIDVVAAPAPA